MRLLEVRVVLRNFAYDKQFITLLLGSQKIDIFPILVFVQSGCRADTTLNSLVTSGDDCVMFNRITERIRVRRKKSQIVAMQFGT